LIDGNEHYIHAPQPELYDLAADPAEKHNDLQQNRRAYVRLRQAIEPYVHEVPAPSSIDREEAAKLAALGYVGSTAATTAGKELADPKTTIGTVNDIRRAFTWYGDGKEDDALRLTNQLLAANSQITDIWDLKVKILNKMGRQRDALEAAKDGLRNVPSAIALLYDVANDALAVGDLDTAQKHAEIAETIEPGEAHDILARIWARRGDMKRAEAEAKLSLETSHHPTNSLMLLADAEKKRGNLDAALTDLDRAVEATKRDQSADAPQGLHLARGDVLARLGRNAEAESEFRAEIAQFPKLLNAYSSLVMLLATERKLDEATKVVFDVIQASPEPHTYVIVAETLKAIGDDRGAQYWAHQGLQRYPSDAELRALPDHLRRATHLLQKPIATN
jgi:tetratricopeptide (TPR) repeat protein